ncbi:RloB family protein [Natronoflexus pectinivorans]|uniref:RloB-like protein n=1 Tax=Natronoflexus pectinivorans TaxID=682526 RepID=A0A4R2GFL9_9BACT|nr:RloB family protein [Natronoflexus pectinivorans]TCO07003.1 RloB-like protein [Natronoflexus pectinivorans]
MAKSIKQTILIICEGESTEPRFFDSIRDEILNGVYNIGDVEIKISPEPKVDESEEEGVEEVEVITEHKAVRPKRQVKIASVGVEPEQEKIPLPLKWVLEGQQELRDGTYNEVWTVFDHDNHPARKEAFEAAAIEINGSKVNIAFTSISFEYYLLLHFERLYKPFKTSECRDKNNPKKSKRKKSILCGTNKHIDDCHGEHCIGGHARINNYWTDSKDKISKYLLVKDKLEIGFEIAAWLRYISSLKESELQEYDRNPYLTTDRIVKRLTGNDHRSWQWLSLDFEYKFEDLGILIDSNKRLAITNLHHSKSLLLKRNSIIKISSDNTRRAFGNQSLMSPQTTEFIDISAFPAEWYLFQHENYNLMFSFNDYAKISSIINKLFSLSHKELSELYNILKSQLK